MRVATGYEHRRPRIEIVALIDVMFLLLIFFIYATLSSTVMRGVQVDLPRGAAAGVEGALVVILDRSGAFYMEERRMNPDEVVRAILSREPGEPVLIRGDRRADLGVAVELLHRLQAAGIPAVSFQVEADE